MDSSSVGGSAPSTSSERTATAGEVRSVTRPRAGPVPGAGRGRDGVGRTPSFVVGTYRGLGANPVMGESFCRCPAVAQGRYRYLDCQCGEEDNVFEWGWDPDLKSSATEISPEGRGVKFHVNYSCGTAAVRGILPMIDGQYFWEIKMTTPVYGTDMMIGVGTKEVNLDAYKNHFCSLLGRDGESWGLSYMGRMHHKGMMQKYGSRFGHGSIIGVHLDMWMGTLAFYKNRIPMGLACRGLNGKVVYPMVSSTAAQSGMKIIKARSFQTSLQFMCCQVLRQIIPSHLDVLEVLEVPPGLREFLDNNLSWLLKPSELAAQCQVEPCLADCTESPVVKETPAPVPAEDSDDNEEESDADTVDTDFTDFSVPVRYDHLEHTLSADPQDGPVPSTSSQVTSSGPCGLLVSQHLESTNPDERQISIIEQTIHEDAGELTSTDASVDSNANSPLKSIILKVTEKLPLSFSKRNENDSECEKGADKDSIQHNKNEELNDSCCSSAQSGCVDTGDVESEEKVQTESKDSSQTESTSHAESEEKVGNENQSHVECVETGGEDRGRGCEEPSIKRRRVEDS